MIIHSDWHIHSENSCDASCPITTIGDNANTQGLRGFGITDHANLNDPSFRKNIEDSAKNVKELQGKYPNMVLGVELGAALKENGKFVECTAFFFHSPATTEKFRHQYAEFLRELFEMGIPITCGSDSHHTYGDHRQRVESYLVPAGFADGDFSDLSEKDFW